MAIALPDNPFTPTFGGLPERFFGRTDVIERVRLALEHPKSPDAALFITGTRGCGKTALLERLSVLAKSQRWLVVDVHSLGAVNAIVAQLAMTGTRLEANAKPKVSFPGGIDVSVGSINALPEPSQHDLVSLLMQTSSSLTRHRGIFITIDEVQKISEEEMEEICAAVQMSRRKGLPVALMLAGLPGSKELVASYKGCTFMQRVADVRLQGLMIAETIEAFHSLLALAPDVECHEEIVTELAAQSQGYPYLVQLVGYHFVEHVRAANPVGMRVAQLTDVIAIEDAVYETYRSNVLKPSTKGLGREARAYLRTMAALLDDEGFANTGQIASSLGKEPKQLSSCRQILLQRRIILSGGYGKVCYGLPYLMRFSTEMSTGAPEDFTGRYVPR